MKVLFEYKHSREHSEATGRRLAWFEPFEVEMTVVPRVGEAVETSGGFYRVLAVMWAFDVTGFDVKVRLE